MLCQLQHPCIETCPFSCKTICPEWLLRILELGFPGMPGLAAAHWVPRFQKVTGAGCLKSKYGDGNIGTEAEQQM